MPNIASSKKRVRTIAKRTAINHSRLTRIRTFTRKVEEAITAGDYEAALAALRGRAGGSAGRGGFLGHEGTFRGEDTPDNADFPAPFPRRRQIPRCRLRRSRDGP